MRPGGFGPHFFIFQPFKELYPKGRKAKTHTEHTMFYRNVLQNGTVVEQDGRSYIIRHRRHRYHLSRNSARGEPARPIELAAASPVTVSNKARRAVLSHRRSQWTLTRLPTF